MKRTAALLFVVVLLLQLPSAFADPPGSAQLTLKDLRITEPVVGLQPKCEPDDTDCLTPTQYCGQQPDCGDSDRCWKDENGCRPIRVHERCEVTGVKTDFETWTCEDPPDTCGAIEEAYASEGKLDTLLKALDPDHEVPLDQVIERLGHVLQRCKKPDLALRRTDLYAEPEAQWVYRHHDVETPEGVEAKVFFLQNVWRNSTSRKPDPRFPHDNHVVLVWRTKTHQGLTDLTRFTGSAVLGPYAVKRVSLKAVPKNKLGWTHVLSFDEAFGRSYRNEDGCCDDHRFTNTNNVMLTIEDEVQRRFHYISEVRERLGDGRSEVECSSTLTWSKGVFQLDTTRTFYRWTTRVAADGKSFTLSSKHTAGEPKSWKRTFDIDQLSLELDKFGCYSRAKEW